MFVGDDALAVCDGEAVAAAELGCPTGEDVADVDKDAAVAALDDDEVDGLPPHPTITTMTAPSAIGPSTCFTISSF